MDESKENTTVIPYSPCFLHISIHAFIFIISYFIVILSAFLNFERCYF